MLLQMIFLIKREINEINVTFDFPNEKHWSSLVCENIQELKIKKEKKTIFILYIIIWSDNDQHKTKWILNE